MTSIEAIISDLLVKEGGFVQLKEDKGGATNRGITQATLAEWRGKDVTVEDVKLMREDEARAIYHDRYILKPGFATLPDPLRALVVDSAVNHGVDRATRWLQRAVKVAEDGILGGASHAAIASCDVGVVYRRVLADRIRFYGRIVTDNPKQALFAAGWANRAASFVEGTP
jgi:lysozyme family protein